jgi:hypothetical protein
MNPKNASAMVSYITSLKKGGNTSCEAICHSSWIGKQTSTHERSGQDCGGRPPLQNEKKTIPLVIKIDLIERLTRTGLREIEAGSFVAPAWVPQVCYTARLVK